MIRFPHQLARLIGRVRRDERGMPLIEFAIALPLLVLLCFGAIEIGLFSLINMKLQSSVSNLASLVSRGPELSQADMDDIFESVHANMAPFATGANTAFVVTSVAADPNLGAAVSWQRTGGGTLGASSRVGGGSGQATVPSDIPLDEATIIIVEAFYSYDEALLGIVDSMTLYKVAYHRPRFGALENPE